MQFVKYDPDTGEILGRFLLSDASKVYSLYGPNIIPLSPIQHDQALDVSYRVESGALIEKIAISLTASKTSILSNGTDVATIAVNGLVGSIRIDMGPISTVVTTDDPYIVLSSEVPQKFPLLVVPDRYHYGTGMLTIISS